MKIETIKNAKSGVWIKLWININDQLHNENGPARICYFPDSNVSSECYYINGKLHRLDGPAMIYYHCDGIIDDCFYCLNGKPFGSLKELQDYNKTLILN